MRQFRIEKKLILYIAFYLVFIIDLALVLPYQVKKVLSVHSENKTLGKKINQFKREDNLQAKFIDEQETVEVEMINLASQILAPDDISAISAYISDKAKTNAVELLEISPGEMQEHETNSEGKFSYLPLNIRVNSGFHNLAQFVNSLERGKYFLKIEKLRIREETPYHKVEISVNALVKE